MAVSEALPTRVRARIPQLARAMIATFLEEIPVYRLLPREQLEGEILRICEENLRIFFRCLAEERQPNAAELADPRSSAVRRAEERVPLEAVITAYHIGARIGWEALVEEARADELGELGPIGSRVVAYVQALSSTVAAAYVEERQLIFGEERDARRALVEAMLAPGPRADPDRRERIVAAAEFAGVELAPAYAVAAVRIGPSPDEQVAGVSASVAGRRKTRRLLDRLEQLGGHDVLSLLDPHGGLLVGPLDPSQADEALAQAAETVQMLAEAADADVLAGVTWRPGAERVAEAAEEAREILRLAQRLGASRGAFRLQDVLLEHLASADVAAGHELRQMLAPLEERAELLATVEQWFAADFDRRAAATALHVHPNTLDYRLRRVAELTGLDPTSARGLQLLGVALTARKVAGASG